jgi:two-component system, cell cycle sensor histidine kinase DivJ
MILSKKIIDAAEKSRMKALLPELAESLGRPQVLPAKKRLQLFRQSRIAIACVMLLIFPMMAALSLEPKAVIASLALFGILPAVVALDTKRPAQLDRALLASMLAAGVVLFAGVLRGLNGISAAAILALLLVEALTLARPAMRKTLLMLASLGIVGTVTAGHMLEPVFGVGQWSLTAITCAMLAHVIAMALGLNRIMRDKLAAQKSIHPDAEGFDAILDQTMIHFERNGAILHVSDNCETILNIPASELLGRGLIDLILVSERPALLTTLSTAAATQTPRTVHLHMRRSLDDAIPHYRWVELKVAPAASGQLIGALRDVDDEINEEGELQRARDAAAQAKLARSAFLSTINHELRTPLNAIIGFSEILSNPQTIPVNAAKTQEYATLIHGAGRDLFRKISAMVDVTRLDSGVYDINKEPTDIISLLESAVESFRLEPDANAVPVEFIKDATIKDHLDVDLDSGAMRSILFQLLSNAAKFGGALKPIQLHLMASDKDITISIKDSGPGIPQEKLELLGTYFARLDETLNRAHGGIGLGLSLTRGIVALHHGHMRIESRTGKGTNVMLTLPRNSDHAVASGSMSHANLVQLQKPNTPLFDQSQDRRYG